MMTPLLLAVLVASCPLPASAPPNPHKAFIKAWQGRQVVVTRTLATTLTVQWLTDLSQSLTERPEIERLIAQFLTAKPR